jgi:hypothetical protein
MTTEWIVHPNRSALGPDKASRNGHYRTVSRAPAASVSVSTCLARVTLPRTLSHLADTDGSVTFGGLDWWFVVGAARTFSREQIGGEVPPPFGFKNRGAWRWWDNTTSDESVLDAPDAIDHVGEYLDRLFPGLAVDVSTR